jgi:hypothetical protein
MSPRRARLGPFVFVIAVPLAAAVAAAGCGSSSTPTGSGSHAGGGTATSASTTGAGGTGVGGDIGIGGMIDHGALQSIAVTPNPASIELLNGTPGKQAFQVTATYADNTTAPITDATWAATNIAVGSIDGSGLFSATGAQGGVVTVSASSGGKTATAVLTVKLHHTQNPAGADMPTQTTLQGASAPDGSIVWAYPYDGTVFPRGIGGPSLEWQGGGAADVYYVHLTSPTFELESYTTAPGSRYDFVSTEWDAFANSTTGTAELKVSRLAGGMATLLVDHHWTIAPSSMRGTIYYWAINTGRVMRIKPGATAPDDFLGPSVTCPSCHTVSANGSNLVMNEGSWPSETTIAYDLKADSNAFSGFSDNTGASRWALPAVSADGKVVVENFAPLRGPIGQVTGAFDAVTAAQLPSTGLEGKQLWMPAFSPDDKLLAYVDSQSKDLRAYDWDEVAKQASNDRLIMAAGGDPATSTVSFPTASPDHQWLVYQRSSGLGSLGNASDLYIASVASPGTEVPLDALNGKSYPFAAGNRDRALNYEPTFAPVAAGGFFWVVFHSRRTYGTELTGPAYVGEGNGTKQLWVAAIDQSPQPGKDPSHPAFHLPGQDLGTLNMRGYWALDPCKGDGEGCASGTECCGGYCDGGGDGGQPVCKSSSGNGCSQSGDHCDTDADCCNSDSGETCINHVCSDPPPPH